MSTKVGEPAGRELKTIVEWDSRRASAKRLDQTPRNLDQSAAPPVYSRRRSVGKRPSTDEVASVVRQMSILVRAGVPLVESLQGLAEQTRSQALKASLEQMAADVSHGMALSDAFARQAKVFPALAAEMSRIAEAGGSLAETLGRLAAYLENSAEISRKVKSALAYPIVVLAISVVTVLAMVTFILPRFMKLFSQMGAKLPWTTKMLMGVSHAVLADWYWFLGAVALGYYLGRRYLRSERGRSTVDALLLRLPLIGEIVHKIVLSRAIATMATLLASGVPMVKTLETSAAAADNHVVEQALLKAKQDVAEGTTTSQALRSAGVFPPLILQMVASGEKTGELPSMLEYVCSLYARETDAKVKALTSVIEPVMIVVLGFVVGFIAISIIVPIYSLVGGVK
ncbi:MAG: type II secretion system F family protein [Armatimonadota bacterium]|nr:type II secretion system F family protein [Armatimonadota bacterium]